MDFRLHRNDGSVILQNDEFANLGRSPADD